MAFYASKEMKEIKDYIAKNSNKHEHKYVRVDVQAPAGSGKTTTILYLLEELTQNNNCVYLVFNTQMNKEMKQRLDFSNSPFDINKEHLEQYTFHGYIRKELQKKLPNIGFDFNNGSINEFHLGKIFTKLNIDKDGGLTNFIDSFNNFINNFVKTTQGLEDFKKANENKQIVISDDSFEVIKKILKITHGYDASYFNEVEAKEKEKLTKEAYYTLIEEIFENDALNEIMPHEIYYKYVYLHYGNINLFSDYDYVLVDEAQDIDMIITELLKKSNVNIIKFGDNFQKINGFRGTVNALGNDKNTKTFFLTASYRLTPYMGLITEAFLNKEGVKFGYENKNIPTIYGYSKNSIPIKDAMVSSISKESFFDKLIDDIGSIDIYDSYTYIETKRSRERIEESIFDNKKTIVSKALKSFAKSRDYQGLYQILYNHTSLFSNHSQDDLESNLASLESKENLDLIKQLNKLARDYTFKLNKREMREILVSENGTYGYVTRNNKKSINALHSLLTKMPQEAIFEIPLFNIKFALSIADTFDNIRKNAFHKVSSKDNAIFINQLSSLESTILKGFSIWDIKNKLAKKEIPDKLFSLLINDANFSFTLVNIKILQIRDMKFSLSDFDVSGVDLKQIIDNAVKQTKIKTKQESVTLQDIKEHGYINTVDRLVPFDKFVRSQIDRTIFERDDIKLGMLENFYKYTEILELVKNNPNVELVKDGAFYNCFFSTTHQVKGLELDNVMIGNDIYDIEGTEQKDLKEVEEEFNLAYVALTRTKNAVFLENGSPLEDIFENILEENFCRYYKVKNEDILIVEKLVQEDNNDMPTYEVYHKNNIDYKIEKEIAYLMENATYPNIRNASVVIDSESNYKALRFKDAVDGYVISPNERQIGLEPLSIDNDGFEEIIQDWKNELEVKEIEFENDLENAPF